MFERNIGMIEKNSMQDEKDFTIDVPANLQNDRVHRKGKKSDVPDENLIQSTNKMSRKVMLSAAISWYGATKPVFVNENGIKVNKENYCKHLKNSCFLQLKISLGVMTGCLSKTVLHHIDRIWYKISLKKL